MFSNPPGLILAVLILSQVSYNMATWNGLFSYVDSVLLSFKESYYFFFPITYGICFVSLVSLLQGYQLSFVLLPSLKEILSCNYFNVVILSTQAPALCLSPVS